MPAKTRKATAKRTAEKARKSRAARGAKARPARTPFSMPSGWALDRGGKSMSREVRTKDFLEAIDVINAIAPVAEELEHHPDLHLEQWNRLRVTTWSHDVGKLTERDRRLAERVDEVLRKLGVKDGG